MRTSIFWGILIIYSLLLSGSGYLTFFHYQRMVTLPSDQMLQRAAADPLFKEQLLIDVKSARDRREQYAKTAAHVFDVVLGALLGFVSAVAATAGLTGGSKETPQKTQKT